MRILTFILLCLLLLAVANPVAAQVVKPTLYDDDCGGGGGGGGGGGCGGDTWCPPECSSCGSFGAIVVSPGEKSWDLSGIADPVTFDLGMLGGRQKIAWTARGSALSFLALDRNANGVIDDGSELFGTATPTRSGGTARNGFYALAEFDANLDAVIDQSDPIWPSLVLWLDGDHDGVSQSDELFAVAASGITSIELSHRWSLKADRNLNYIAYEGRARSASAVLPMRQVFLRRSEQ